MGGGSGAAGGGVLPGVERTWQLVQPLRLSHGGSVCVQQQRLEHARSSELTHTVCCLLLSQVIHTFASVYPRG